MHRKIRRADPGGGGSSSSYVRPDRPAQGYAGQPAAIHTYAIHTYAGSAANRSGPELSMGLSIAATLVLVGMNGWLVARAAGVRVGVRASERLAAEPA